MLITFFLFGDTGKRMWPFTRSYSETTSIPFFIEMNSVLGSRDFEFRHIWRVGLGCSITTHKQVQKCGRGHRIPFPENLQLRKICDRTKVQLPCSAYFISSHLFKAWRHKVKIGILYPHSIGFMYSMEQTHSSQKNITDIDITLVLDMVEGQGAIQKTDHLPLTLSSAQTPSYEISPLTCVSLCSHKGQKLATSEKKAEIPRILIIDSGKHMSLFGESSSRGCTYDYYRLFNSLSYFFQVTPVAPYLSFARDLWRDGLAAEAWSWVDWSPASFLGLKYISAIFTFFFTCKRRTREQQDHGVKEYSRKWGFIN